MVGPMGGRWTADKKRRKNFVLGLPLKISPKSPPKRSLHFIDVNQNESIKFHVVT